MSIKHDNIVPSECTGNPNSAGIPSAIVASVDPATRGTVRYLNSRGQSQQAAIVNATLPPQALPPVAKYQVPGNANSTDYSCGNEAREKVLDQPIPPPPVIVEVLGFYANNDSMPLGYDPTLPASQLIVNTDFWVNLRIQPSVGLDGFDPTIIFLSNNINGTVYPNPTGYPGTFAGDGASNFGGLVYKVPSLYIGQVGLATMTFTAGQPTVNTTFGTATGAIEIVSVPTVVVAVVEQQGWFPGIPALLPASFEPNPPAPPPGTTEPQTADGNVDSVYVGQSLQLAIVGPPSTTYSYILPWDSGTSTTDSTGRSTIPGIAMQAGTWPFTVVFSGIAPVSKSFLVMDSYTAPDGFDGHDSDADADGDADGDGDGDGGDGGGGDGGGGGGGGAM